MFNWLSMSGFENQKQVYETKQQLQRNAITVFPTVELFSEPLICPTQAGAVQHQQAARCVFSVEDRFVKFECTCICYWFLFYTWPGVCGLPWRINERISVSKNTKIRKRSTNKPGWF